MATSPSATVPHGEAAVTRQDRVDNDTDVTEPTPPMAAAIGDRHQYCPTSRPWRTMRALVVAEPRHARLHGRRHGVGWRAQSSASQACIMRHRIDRHCTTRAERALSQIATAAAHHPAVQRATFARHIMHGVVLAILTDSPPSASAAPMPGPSLAGGGDEACVTLEPDNAPPPLNPLSAQSPHQDQYAPAA